MDRGALRGWLLASGIRIVVIIVVAWLVLRVALLATDRLSRELSAGEGVDVIERTKRAQTLGRLIHNVLAVLISSIALLMVLRELGVDIVPMLTGAGIAGVALGFGAQWLVRDVIAGFYLILDNQVRVGDVAAINGVGGIVEAINLRTIVLRDGEGTVHVFQNGAINTLSNRTKDFSFYVIDLNLAYGTDPDRVVAIARRVGEELQADPTYRPNILAPVEIFGVDAFLDSKITIKLRIKTLPQKQWDVGRELRRRLLLALEHEGISLAPPPGQMIVLQQDREARSG
jgi:small conductance mechanosensitive channel